MDITIDKFALKQAVLYLGGKSLELKMVAPNNNHEQKELKKLDEQGLVKFRIIDASAGFIAHKDILQKLIHDLSGQNAFAEIVDRNIKTPSLIHLCASNLWLRKSKLTPEQFKKMVLEENLILKNFKNKKSRQ